MCRIYRASCSCRLNRKLVPPERCVSFSLWSGVGQMDEFWLPMRSVLADLTLGTARSTGRPGLAENLRDRLAGFVKLPQLTENKRSILAETVHNIMIFRFFQPLKDTLYRISSFNALHFRSVTINDVRIACVSMFAATFSVS